MASWIDLRLLAPGGPAELARLQRGAAHAQVRSALYLFSR
jgi:hypothetical protein